MLKGCSSSCANRIKEYLDVEVYYSNSKEITWDKALGMAIVSFFFSQLLHNLIPKIPSENRTSNHLTSPKHSQPPQLLPQSPLFL